jgi:monoamine oxidase
VTDTQVAIVGGGLSGLNTARLIGEAGADFQLFEARDRLGGRILTVDETGAPSGDGFDLGPSWIWPPTLPPDTAALWRETPTWMSSHAKFFAFYERPFWLEAGYSRTAQSMVGPMAEIHDATTRSGRAALFGFLGVGAAERLRIGEPKLTEACLAQLTRIFGPDALAPTGTIFKDWAADPLTATPGDLTSTGHPAPARAWIRGP